MLVVNTTPFKDVGLRIYNYLMNQYNKQYHSHGDGIHKGMAQLDLGKFVAKDARDSLTPQTRRRQDVGLVDACNAQWQLAFAMELAGKLSRDTSDTLHLVGSVDFGITRRFGAFHSFAKVNTAAQFAHDDEIDACDAIGFDWRAFNKRWCRERARAEIGKTLELLTQLQDP